MYLHGDFSGKTPRVLVRRARRIALYAVPALLALYALYAVVWFGPAGPSDWGLLLQMLGVALVAAVFYLRNRVLRRFVQTVREAEYRVCPTCGYPLKGLADAGNCPECGEAYELDALREQWESAVKPMFQWPRNKSK